MKITTKLFALVLAALLALTLCACEPNSDTPDDVSQSDDSTLPDDTTDEDTSAEETDAPETDAPETDAPETDAPETDAPETDAPETDAPETDAPETDAPETDAPETDAPETDAPETDAPETDTPETDAPETDTPEVVTPDSPIDDGTDVLGTTAGKRYENARIGLGFLLSDGWEFYSEEQIRALNNVTAELAGEDYKALIENATLFYDMYAADADGLNNININLEKLNALQIAALDVAKNFEATVPYLREVFENMGYENFAYEITTVQIDGETYAAMKIAAQIGDLNVYQLSLGVKCSGYLANIAVTTYIEDTTAEILDTFYVIG